MHAETARRSLSSMIGLSAMNSTEPIPIGILMPARKSALKLQVRPMTQLLTIGEVKLMTLAASLPPFWGRRSGCRQNGCQLGDEDGCAHGEEVWEVPSFYFVLWPRDSGLPSQRRAIR